MGTNVNLSGKEDGNHGGSSSQQGGGGGAGGDTASSGVRTSNGSAAAAATATAAASQGLKHDPGLVVDWSAEELATLDEMLGRYASEAPIFRYAKVALHLPEKTVRDVALRCRWMTKKESGKRRKDDSLSRKGKDKKERTTDSSVKPSPNLAARPTPYAMPLMSMENDDDISCNAIGGPTGQLLDQTAQIFSQISGNFNPYQINDNLALFCQARDNILNIMNELDDVQGIMSQMPPLPVRLNEELANSILPRSPMPPP